MLQEESTYAIIWNLVDMTQWKHFLYIQPQVSYLS